MIAWQMESSGVAHSQNPAWRIIVNLKNLIFLGVKSLIFIFIIIGIYLLAEFVIEESRKRKQAILEKEEAKKIEAQQAEDRRRYHIEEEKRMRKAETKRQNDEEERRMKEIAQQLAIEKERIERSPEEAAKKSLDSFF